MSVKRWTARISIGFMRSTARELPSSAKPLPRPIGTARPRPCQSSAMPEIAILILAAVAVLMLKHMAADFFLQTPYQYCNKGTYGHPGGLLHSFIHIALTPLVYLVLAPVSLLFALAIAAGEFAVHYHVDWAKEQIT